MRQFKKLRATKSGNNRIGGTRGIWIRSAILFVVLALVFGLYSYVRSTGFIRTLSLAYQDYVWCTGDEQVIELGNQTTGDLQLCRLPSEPYFTEVDPKTFQPVLSLAVKSHSTQSLSADLKRAEFSYKGLPFKSTVLAKRLRDLGIGQKK